MDMDAAIDDWAARAERQSALTAELGDELQRAQASAQSRGGEVEVTVNHAGGLADLRLSSRAMTLSEHDLGKMILATSQRAQANLARQVTELVNSLYGEGSETATFVGGTYAEQFPDADIYEKDRDEE